MADDKQEPQFLGGGPKFNRVGAQPQDGAPAPGVPAAPSLRPRSLIIALVVVLLMGLLYWITSGPSGLVHVGGHAGTSPDARPTAPDSSPGSPVTP